jgi:hypothetical protein
MDMAVHEWFQMQEPGFHHDQILKLVPKWNKRAFVLRDYAEKY